MEIYIVVVKGNLKTEYKSFKTFESKSDAEEYCNQQDQLNSVMQRPINTSIHPSTLIPSSSNSVKDVTF